MKAKTIICPEFIQEDFDSASEIFEFLTDRKIDVKLKIHKCGSSDCPVEGKTIITIILHEDHDSDEEDDEDKMELFLKMAIPMAIKSCFDRGISKEEMEKSLKQTAEDNQHLNVLQKMHSLKSMMDMLEDLKREGLDSSEESLPTEELTNSEDFINKCLDEGNFEELEKHLKSNSESK